jgi:hypothetical protein
VNAGGIWLNATGTGAAVGGPAVFTAGNAYGFEPLGGGVGESDEKAPFTPFHAFPSIDGSSFFGASGGIAGRGGGMTTFAHGDVGTVDLAGVAAAGKYDWNDASGSVPRAVGSVEGSAIRIRAAGPWARLVAAVHVPYAAPTPNPAVIRRSAIVRVVTGRFPSSGSGLLGRCRGLSEALAGRRLAR